MTPEREQYNGILKRFAAEIQPGSAVCDIGKSGKHDYSPLFDGSTFVTIDRNPDREADILVDLERPYPVQLSESYDVLLCTGVTENCDNPVALLIGCRGLVKTGGRALFGIMLVGYPISDKADFTRYTPNGALRLLERSCFEVKEATIVHRNEIPTYLFASCLAVSQIACCQN